MKDGLLDENVTAAVASPCVNLASKSFWKKIKQSRGSRIYILKREVDKWYDELNRLDAHPNVKTNLWVAQKELAKFTSKKRKEGVNI